MEAEIVLSMVKGDKNTKFFHRVASTRMRANRINFLMEGDSKLEDRDNIIKHAIDFFVDLYSKEDWSRPALNNLDFVTIGTNSGPGSNCQ